MKTIFITSFHQFISRNILQTPILEGFCAMPDVHVIIIAPADKREYFEREFSRDRVRIEYVPTSRKANGFRSLLFKRSVQALGDLGYKNVLRGFRPSALRSLLANVFFYYPLRALGKFSAVHAFIRFLGSRLVANPALTKIFAAHAPDLVFATDMQNENDVALMIEAKRRGVKIVSMVRSWDNVEMYGGVLRVIPDSLLVWGDFSKEGILKVNAIDPGMVKAVGVPHYDRYLAGPTMTREAFLRSLGADPRRKLILFTPVGDMYLAENDADRFVLAELTKMEANILVRMPPADTVSWGTFTPPPNVFFYQPGTAIDAVGRREISRADDDHLINSLHFAEVVVSGPSSIMLDAAAVGKPVVLFGFDAQPKSYRESIASLYDSRHLQAIISRGAARFTRNVEEFRAAIAAYLAHPDADAAARAQAVAYVCYKADGASCARVLDALKSVLFSRA